MKRPTLARHVHRKPKSIEQLRARVCNDPLYNPRVDYLYGRPEPKNKETHEPR